MKTNDRGRCPECGGKDLEPRPYTHVQKVGAFTITDKSGVVPHCPACGTPAMNLDDLSVYERAAARTALLEGKYDGDVVRFARKAIGLTQTQLGDVVGYSAEMISKYENGKETVQKAYALALCSLLDMTPEEVMEHADVSGRPSKGPLEGRRRCG